MEKDYYILSAENAWFPLGCLFVMSEPQKLLCLDNDKLCTNLNKVFGDCIKIDRKSANLLQAVPPKDRVSLCNDKSWQELTGLDVGDECFHMMTGHEMPCKIVSKQLGEKGITFSITMENGKRCNLTIDRLRVKKNSLTSQSVKSRVSTWSSRSITTYDRLHKPEPISSCKCLSNILQKANDLELTLKEKEDLFRHLFTILPKLPVDDEGRCSIHWACYYLLADCVTILINAEDVKNRQDKQGNVPLFLAINSPLAEIKDAQTYKNLERIIITLVNHGADINIRNNQNETPLMKAFKNGHFKVLEILLENFNDEFYLSDHLLSDKASILELLVKLKMFNLASLCCKRSKNDREENQIFLKSAVSAVVSGANELCIELLEKSTNVNENLPNGEVFLTEILGDATITSDTVCAILNSISFKLDKCNKKYQHPLSLACRRLLVDVAKLIISKSFVEMTLLNDALGETILAYNEVYIKFTYKSVKLMTFQSVAQIKQVTIEILNLLLKNGANIETANPSIISSIDNCVDSEFAKVIKHVIKLPATANRDSTDHKLSMSLPVQSTNQCPICMDRLINCAFSCGHTCCFECGDKLFECHACRIKVTERRKIFIS